MISKKELVEKITREYRKDKPMITREYYLVSDAVSSAYEKISESIGICKNCTHSFFANEYICCDILRYEPVYENWFCAGYQKKKTK